MGKGVFKPLDEAFERSVVQRRAGGRDPYSISPKSARTPNQELARLLMGLVWSMMTDPSLIPKRALAVIAFFELQQRLGLQCLTDEPRVKRWRDERLTASHHYVWSKWIYGTIAVLLRSDLDLPGLRRVLELCLWWVDSQATLWNVVDRWGVGTIAMAGARAGADDDRTDDGGQSGVDKDGPRNPVNAMRDFEWRSILSLGDRWKAKNRETAITLAIGAGYRPRLDMPLPLLSEPMVVEHYENGVLTAFPLGPPGQGGAQFVFMMSDGSYLNLTEERAQEFGGWSHRYIAPGASDSGVQYDRARWGELWE